MNRFNTFTLLLILCSLFHLGAFAQSDRHIQKETTLNTTVETIRELISKIGLEMLDALEDIDFETLADDIEEIAALSEAKAEQAALEIAGIDWEQFGNPYDMTSPLGFQKEKVIEKVYPINHHTKVSIDNRYGKITLHNWNRNEIKVTIKIRTAENSEKRAESAFDRVNIDESKSANSISFKTNIASSDESGWWSSLTSGTAHRALQIDYEVYMPKENELALANRYGAIELDDRDGKVAISVSYGSLQAGRLNGPDNSLAVAYSKADVQYLNEGDVSVRYGGFTLSETEKISLAMNISSGGYIGKVNREADISLRYSGGFEMGIGPAIQKANVAASYSSIHIKPADDAAFNFNVAISYGGFDYDHNRINIESKSEGNTSKSYTGYWNKAVNSSISISSRYGAVSLK
ncbi:hypothetical protein [Parapedobacter koreensis]|uniref:Adhesin domain-containing protein n=1 Tax=Parapedobacter koreensis TaxID=332977 RepID=A0A1H7NVW5_9SPHI|nr:hypothetical protein [Parapedobacter koreensis]SEL27439.1 hypothetical protein SAMN05421740_104115 [Parapedobacter koreensis]